MKRLLTITTATIALGALAACGNSDTTAYNDDQAENERAEDQAGDTTMSDETVSDTASADNDAPAPRSGYGSTGGYGLDGDSRLTQEQRAELETRLAEASSPTIEYEGQTYLTYAALNARDITGAEVTGADGERVASVDDVILGEDGQVDRLLLSSGGLLGLGDDQVTVDFAEVNVAFGEGNEPRIRTSLSENAIDTMGEFDEATLGDSMMLASEVLGREVTLGETDDTASVYDLIMTEAGETDYAVLSTGLGSDRYLVEFSALQPGTEENTYMVTMTPDRLQENSRIVYF